MQKIDVSRIDIRDYLQRVVDSIIASHRNPHLQVSFDMSISSIACSSYTAVNVAQLVKELIENALRHGYKGRTTANIKITLTENEDHCCLVVADDGNGLNEENDPYKRLSSGLQLLDIFVANLKGCVRVTRSHGTRFEIDFLCG